MKIDNETQQYEDYFLRRLTSWCCREIGFAPSYLGRATFRNYRGNPRCDLWSGRARYRQYSDEPFTISVWVRRDPFSGFPDLDYRRGHKDPETGVPLRVESQLEALVLIVAHEVSHLLDYLDYSRRIKKSPRKDPERYTRTQSRKVLERFRENSWLLLAEWLDPPAKRKPKEPVKTEDEKKAEEAAARLKAWNRKLALARTKVKKYKAQSAYYEKKLVAAANKRKG